MVESQEISEGWLSEEDFRSSRKESELKMDYGMESVKRKQCCGGRGICLIESLVKTGKCVVINLQKIEQRIGVLH